MSGVLAPRRDADPGLEESRMSWSGDGMVVSKVPWLWGEMLSWVRRDSGRGC